LANFISDIPQTLQSDRKVLHAVGVIMLGKRVNEKNLFNNG